MSNNIDDKLMKELLAKKQTLLVSDFASLEVGIQADLCERLFGDSQMHQMYDMQDKRLGDKAVDIHSSNARAVFGKWLGWKVPSSVIVEGKPILCKYAGETADAIPVHEFKKHPYGGVLRDMIKAIWYGLAYGKGAYGFSTLKGADGKPIGEATAQLMIDALLDAVPGMRKWFKWVEDFVRAHHCIYSIGGRWCDLSEEMESDDEWRWKRAFRRAFNFPMQATGAEIIGDVMVRVMRCIKLRALGFRTCLQVHDEIVLRGPLDNVEEASYLLGGHMENATANGIQLMVKLQYSIGHGPNYFEAK